MEKVRSKYISIIDKNEKKYETKMVGLNPNMRPTANKSLTKIFPMQGLWSPKQLLVRSRDVYGVSEAEQLKICEETSKDHFKKMYKQKEYMEEYLKYKDVISGMKK